MVLVVGNIVTPSAGQAGGVGLSSATPAAYRGATPSRRPYDARREVAAMDTIILGRSGLRTAPISLGTWQFGGEWGAFDEGEATATIRRALELGITLFDTAQAYGFGVSERVLGRALADVLRDRREDVVIATKGGLRIEGSRMLRDSSPAWLRRGVEESLRTLGVDHIDLYQLHWPDRETPAEATGEALRRMVDEGRIRHVGVSNFSPAQMDDLSRTLPVETLQPPYHLFRRDVEADVLPYAREHDMGVLAYGPLAHGLLGGRMGEATTFAPGDWRGASPDFRGEPFRRNLEVAGELERFAAERGWTLPGLAVAWTLAHPAVHVTILGARRPEQLEALVGAAGIRLGDDDLAEIDRIMAAAAPVAGPSPEMV
jgi:aryl-alcohol dehydrogenase-like predicted oxidoreductase